jgi:hypothetical protein
VRRRRRSGAVRLTVLVGAPLAGWLAFRLSSGRSLLVFEALLAAVFLGAVLVRPDPDTGRWLRGAGGEVATAEELGRLPVKRWEVFHDLAVPGSNANIDHLAVGPTGVWVIDSKTSRAALAVGMFSVRFGERRLDTESVRWQAGVVGDRLGVRARPLIAVHCNPELGGSRLPRRGIRRGGVRIVLAGDVVRRMRRGRRRLGRGDVQSLAGEVLTHFRPASGSARQNGARD